MNILLFLVAITFKEFKLKSEYFKTLLAKERLKYHETDFLDILPLDLDFSFQTYRFNGNDRWLYYYTINIPIFTSKHVLFYPRYRNIKKLKKLTDSLAVLRAEKTMLMIYSKLWYYSRIIDVMDSLIFYYKKARTLYSYLPANQKKVIEEDLKLFEAEQELTLLVGEREQLLKRIKSDKTYEIVIEETYNELVDMAIKLKNTMDSLNLKIEHIRYRLARMDEIDAYSRMLPHLSYLYMRQFAGFDPLNPVGSNTISGISLNFNLSVPQCIKAIKRARLNKRRLRVELEAKRYSEKHRINIAQVNKMKINTDRMDEMLNNYYKKIKLGYENNSLKKEDYINELLFYHEKCRYLIELKYETLMNILSK